jgi:DNA repair exonuclease SbcCD ATPase subunit
MVSTHDNNPLSWVHGRQSRARHKETQMARGITQSDVEKAADSLLLAGKRPTVERVRQHLGTGSPNTVTRMLDAWWKALGTRLSAQQRNVTMPAAPDAVAALASQLWEEALLAAHKQAELRLAGERESLTAARLDVDARVAAANQSAEAARDSQVQAVAALEAARERLEDRQQLITQQVAQLADLTRQRDDATARALQSDRDAVELRKQLDAARLKAETHREAQAAHVKAVEDRAHSEVDRARQQARELKTELHAQERAQSARVRQLETELSQARAAAAAAAQALAGEKARRETVERQMEDLRRSLHGALTPTVRVRSPRKPTKANSKATPTSPRARSKRSQ